jgi:predicted ABC-type transport system involved in lysophospholipase L1 biosynthesis ATPase subunit
VTHDRNLAARCDTTIGIAAGRLDDQPEALR